MNVEKITSEGVERIRLAQDTVSEGLLESLRM